MNKGIVNFFNESKAYGFIKDTEEEKEYFVHISGLIDKVNENDEVTFGLREGEKRIKCSKSEIGIV